MLPSRSRASILAIIATSTPAFAHASNFNVLLHFLYGVCGLVAAVLALAAHHSARAVESRFARALIWGCWSALVLTPLSVPGGNGTLSGTPLLAFTSLIFGADPVYAVAAVKLSLVSAPVCTLVLWQILRLWAAAGEKDKRTGSDA